MQKSQPSVFMRNDTLFGVCEGLGQDFGFNPLFLRVVLGVSLLWSPVVVLATYFGAGVVVMISRLLFPNPRPTTRPEQAAVAPRAADSADSDMLAVAA